MSAAPALTPAAEFREKVWAEERQKGGGLLAYTLEELAVTTFPDRRPLLCRGDVPVLSEGDIGQLTATRGNGKTWFLQTLALVASAQIEALGFRAPEPCRVLYIDGEMSSQEIKKRFLHLRDIYRAKPQGRLTVLGADWQEEFLRRLDTADGQVAVEPFVASADLIFQDNRSCLFDPEGEKDPSAWQLAQDWLLSLRRRGKASILAHHANRQGGARGIGKAEDPMNVLLKLSRPHDYTPDQGARLLVEWEKTRGIYGSAVEPFVAALTDHGWVIEAASQAEGRAVERKLIDYLLAAASLGESPTTGTAVVGKSGAGVNKQAGLKALEGLIREGRVRKVGKAYVVA